jgi:hypothetical protein
MSIKYGESLFSSCHPLQSKQPLYGLGLQSLTLVAGNILVRFDPMLADAWLLEHAVGTILYFDELSLDQHIILMPTHLIDAFKSIITDKIFCNIELYQRRGGILEKLSIQGRLMDE